MKVSISVIIPCRNEEKYIEKCIHSIQGNDYPHHLIEILVVDGMSEDNTREIVNRLKDKNQNIRLIDNPDHITPIALNLGIKSALNEYILIVSSHSTYLSNYITTLANKILELNADGVGGQLKTEVLNKSSKSISIAKILSDKLGVGNSMFRIGVNKPTLVDTIPFGLYKKSLFEEVGLYNEDLIRNHDIEWSKRLIAAGKKMYLLPEVSCVYYAREEYWPMAKNNYSNGLWNILAVYLTKSFSSLSLRHFIPLLFLLSLISPLILSILYFPFIYLSALSMMMYLSAIVSRALMIKEVETSLVHIIYGYLTLHFAYGVGSLIGLFKILKLQFSK